MTLYDDLEKFPTRDWPAKSRVFLDWLPYDQGGALDIFFGPDLEIIEDENGNAGVSDHDAELINDVAAEVRGLFYDLEEIGVFSEELLNSLDFFDTLGKYIDSGESEEAKRKFDLFFELIKIQDNFSLYEGASDYATMNETARENVEYLRYQLEQIKEKIQ